VIGNYYALQNPRKVLVSSLSVPPKKACELFSGGILAIKSGVLLSITHFVSAHLTTSGID
jgi:hypothetical protein